MNDYPSGLTLRPIVLWPGSETRNRVPSNFSAPWRSTLDLLDRELHYLGKSTRNAPAVLQIAMREQDFRLDGMPRANAVPTHPGVILAIESKHGPLSYPCDRFTRWQDNLRAIGLALEALRKVDRYGVTKNAEQYTGWKAIESQPATGEQVVNARTALARMAFPETDGVDPSGIDSHDRVKRLARAHAHPDRHGGDRTRWNRVETLLFLVEGVK